MDRYGSDSRAPRAEMGPMRTGRVLLITKGYSSKLLKCFSTCFEHNLVSSFSMLHAAVVLFANHFYCPKHCIYSDLAELVLLCQQANQWSGCEVHHLIPFPPHPSHYFMHHTLFKIEYLS